MNMKITFARSKITHTSIGQEALDICCLIRAESIRYVYLVKKSLIKKLDYSILADVKNLDESDYLISQSLKKIAPLHLMVEESYGELINYGKLPENRKYVEIYRFLENFNLWQRRYAQRNVNILKSHRMERVTVNNHIAMKI